MCFVYYVGSQRVIEWAPGRSALFKAVRPDSLHLKDHQAAAWLNADNLRSVKWLPADEGLVEKIIGSFLAMGVINP